MASGYLRTNHLFEHATKKSALSRAEARQAQLRPGEARPGGGEEAARASGAWASQLRSAPCRGREESEMNIIKILPSYTKPRSGSWYSVFPLAPSFVYSFQETPGCFPPPRSNFTSASWCDTFNFLPIGFKAGFPRLFLGPVSWAPRLSSGSEVPRFFLENCSLGLVLVQHGPEMKLKV